MYKRQEIAILLIAGTDLPCHLFLAAPAAAKAFLNGGQRLGPDGIAAVSYTHLDVYKRQEHCSTQDDGRHQAGGDGQEALAQTHKVDGLLFLDFLAGLDSTIEPGIPQGLDGGCTADHHTGGKHAEYKVQQNAGQQLSLIHI